MFKLIFVVLALTLLAGCATTTGSEKKLNTQELPIIKQLFSTPKPNETKSNLTFENAKQLVKTFIPDWEKAAAQMKSLQNNPPSDYARKTWAHLDSETNALSGIAPLERATDAQDVNDLFVKSTWLRRRILSENADPRYSYAYAGNLNYMRDKNGGFNDEAALFYYHATLSMTIDGSRCLDASSPESIMLGFETQKYMRPLLENIHKMPEKKRATLLLGAVAIEEMRGERPLIKSFCTRGNRTIMRALAAKKEMREVESGPGVLGKTIAVDASGIEPELLDETKWREKRREVLDKYVRDAVAIFNKN